MVPELDASSLEDRFLAKLFFEHASDGWRVEVE